MAVEEPSWRQEHLEVQRAFAKYLGVLEGPYRARIVEDFQFQLDVATPFDPNAIGPDDPGAPSLEDVLERLGTRCATKSGPPIGPVFEKCATDSRKRQRSSSRLRTGVCYPQATSPTN
jgi:hypothetical protein